MNTKKAFIAGIAGQDGSYLTELLLNSGYQVIGIVRDKTKLENIKHLLNKIELHETDLTDFNKLKSIILKSKPNQIYNLGGVTTLSAFANNPAYSNKVTEGSARVIFETAVGLKKMGHDIKIFQASTCLIFGSPDICPQNEHTPFVPVTPYAESKLKVDSYAKDLREKEKLHISCGILYNHESPRRPLDFVTRKITVAAACIYNKVRRIPRDRIGNPIMTKNFMLKIGNINTRRDWGDARDFVKAFRLMLEHTNAEDFVLATGQMHSVQDILEIAFGSLNLDWHDHIIEDKQSIRSGGSNMLCGDVTKARLKLGWKPKIKFEETIKNMVENDIKVFSR